PDCVVHGGVGESSHIRRSHGRTNRYTPEWETLNMKRTLTNQRMGLAGTCMLSLFALLLAVPAYGQDGGRMRILIPYFEGEGRGNPGRNIAESIQRVVDDLPTHVSVARNDY